MKPSGKLHVTCALALLTFAVVGVRAGEDETPPVISNPRVVTIQSNTDQNVTAISQRNAITGAISLTPQAMVDGVMTPAKEVLVYSGLANLLATPVAWQLIGLVFVQVVFVTMVYGPIAAYLVEAFPAKIRYTALSLPYHIGNGVFGGLLPVIGLSICAATGNIYAGLLYPIIIALITFVIGSIFLRETNSTKIWEETEEGYPSPVGAD